MSYDGSLKFDTSIDGKGFESDFKSFGNKVGTIIKGVALGYTGKTLVEYFIGSNADMEQYLTSFEVMLGSAEKAQALMSDIKDMAAKTPLEITDLTKSAQLLMNYGIAADDVINKMTQLGDLALGDAVKLDRISLAYGQMLAKGKVAGEELRQMTEAGVPLTQALADAMGVTTGELSKLIETGKVGIPELNNAIEGLTTGTGKFAGMMSEQAKTMKGMLSTLKDNLVEFGRDAGEKAFEQVKGSLQSLLDMIDKAAKDGTLDDIAEDVGNALNNLLLIIIDVSKFLYEYKDAVIAGAAAMVAFKATLDIGQVANSTITTIKSLKTAISGIGSTTSTLGAVASTAGSAIALVGVSLGIVYGATKAWGASVEYLNNKATESQKQAEQLQSNIDDTKTKLSELNSKIDEIRDKGTITLVDEKQLKAMEDQKEVLESTLKLNEELLKSQKLVAEQDATKALNKKSTGTDALKLDLQTYKDDVESAKALSDEYVQAVESDNIELANSLKSYVEGITPTLEADKNMLLSRKERLAGLMEGISGVTDEGKKAKAELQALINEINTLLGIEDTGVAANAVSETGNYYAESAKQSSARIAAESEKIKTMSDEAFKKQLEDIEGKNTRQLITEEQYYKQKDNLLKKYGKDQLKEYDSFYGSLKNFLEKQGKELSDESEKQAKQEVEVVTDKLKEIKSEYESNYKDILSQQESFSKKLASAEMFGRETVGDKDNVLILTNFKQKFEELEQYQQLLDEIRAKGGNEAFTQQIKDMGVTDAVDFMETLLKSDDMDNYIKSFQEYNDKASEIAQNEYKDEVQSIKDNFSDEVLNTLGEVPQQAALIGEETARLFSEALVNSDALKKLQSIIPINDLNKITSAVSASKANMVNSVATNSSVVRNAALTAPVQQTSNQTVVEVIEIHTTVDLDGKIIGESVTRYQRDKGYQQGRAIK